MREGARRPLGGVSPGEGTAGLEEGPAGCLGTHRLVPGRGPGSRREE